MRELKFVALLVACGCWSGCMAEDPPYAYFDSGVRQDGFPMTPDIEYRCPDTPMAAPVLSRPPQSSAYLRVPIRGGAPGADMVIASGPAGIAKPFTVQSDGSFCLEVDLLPESVNTITIVAVKEGCKSEPATLRIEHRAGKADTTAASTVTNVAQASPTTASRAADDDVSLARLTDGILSSGAVFSMFDPDFQMAVDKFIWVRVDLRKVYTVSRMRVHWSPSASLDGSYALCYSLLLSSERDPEDPSPTSSDWTVAHDTGDGDAEIQEVRITPERARWAALLMYEDDALRWNAMERFALAELEVFGQDPNATPPAMADTCP